MGKGAEYSGVCGAVNLSNQHRRGEGSGVEK